MNKKCNHEGPCDEQVNHMNVTGEYLLTDDECCRFCKVDLVRIYLGLPEDMTKEEKELLH